MNNFFCLVLKIALLWWILTEGDVSSWTVGIPCVLAVSLLKRRYLPETMPCIKIFAFLSFIPYFLYQSLYSGIDIAKRACKPSLPIQPEIWRFSFREMPDKPKYFMAAILSLMPGTLSAEICPDHLLIHSLIYTESQEDEMRDLENRVARIFGIEFSKEKAA